ncbi:hypothetical protein [Psychroserpens sp. NJDZ02]|uniref:hypothetical protein n=1 Tax=Psychroserpens sp. NJDZ02 TaxID=2570561 RepID=UPI0010A92D93|nr:hypothetical protein [Psychroserpens sp. NJDZ02]QCE43264.1 hypothetical protein E9099_18185 [Psychroserpens sp. NJDZ02]
MNLHTYLYKFNKISKIEYTDDKGVIRSTFNLEYNEKNQLRMIDKGYIKYYYEWDANSRLKKITMPDLFYLINEYSFTYVNNRIATIEYIGRYKDDKDDIPYHGKYSYTYKNDKLDKIVFNNTAFGWSNTRLYNYENEDKLIITRYSSKGLYESHYECYY